MPWLFCEGYCTVLCILFLNSLFRTCEATQSGPGKMLTCYLYADVSGEKIGVRDCGRSLGLDWNRTYVLFDNNTNLLFTLQQEKCTHLDWHMSGTCRCKETWFRCPGFHNFVWQTQRVCGHCGVFFTRKCSCCQYCIICIYINLIQYTATGIASGVAWVAIATLPII